MGSQEDKDHRRNGSPQGRATRGDVARAAGVSVTTVTHALNPPPGARVRPATVEKVRRVAKELGYRPSFVGRALVSGRTFTAAALLPSHELASHQLYQDIMLGMTRAMEHDDYNLVLAFRSEDFRYVRLVKQGRVDGMFVLQSDLDARHIEQVIASGIPTVVVNKESPAPADLPVGCVCHDHRAMMGEAVDTFVGLGCKTMLCVIDPRWVDANAIMSAAFVEFTGRYSTEGVVGAVMTPAHERDFRLQIRNAFGCGQRWDAIFTDKLDDAEALLEEADVIGLQPGKDFHLITTDTKNGHTTRDQQEHCAFTQRPEQVGQEAWRILKALITGESPGERVVRLPYERTDLTELGH